MTRRALIERIRRLIYGEQPQDNASITPNLVNQWINDAIGVVVKNNWYESIKLDGVAYINNSFYSTFSDITITSNGINLYSLTLPTLPIGIGKNEGVAAVELYDANGVSSFPLIPLSINQVGYSRSLMPIPNKILYWYENTTMYIKSTLPLNLFTANIRMISGSNSTSLDSELNVPADYVPQIIEYVTKYLMTERATPQDLSNDGRDNSVKQ